MKELNLFNERGERLNLIEVLEILPIDMALPSVTRVEVIDHKGRSYVNWEDGNKVVLNLQDSSRTLKIFISRE